MAKPKLHCAQRAQSNLTRLRSKHIESIPPAVGCSISRSIPSLADMLHIENPEGIYIDAPKAPIPLSPLWQSQNFTCALHELHCVATSLLREQKFAKAKTSLAKRRISQDNGNEQKFPPPPSLPLSGKGDRGSGGRVVHLYIHAKISPMCISLY